MTRTTLEQIEEKIRNSPNIPNENKQEYLNMLKALNSEIEGLKITEKEKAQSIKGFAKISTHEATREKIDPNLMEISIEGLSSSVRELEASNPRLVGLVNSLCDFLSKIGI